MPLLFYYLAPILLVTAVYDMRWRRIPNRITLPLAALGILLQTWTGAGLWHSVTAVLAGGGFFFLCYVFGLMGAGDVKLMAAISAWLGLPELLAAVLLIIFCGGGLAVTMLVRQRLQNGGGGATRGQTRPVTVPYGVAIVTGTVLSLFIVF